MAMIRSRSWWCAGSARRGGGGPRDRRRRLQRTSGRRTDQCPPQRRRRPRGRHGLVGHRVLWRRDCRRPSLDALAAARRPIHPVLQPRRAARRRAPACSPGLYSHQAGMGHLDNVIRRGSPGTAGRLGHPRRLFHAFRDDLFVAKSATCRVNLISSLDVTRPIYVIWISLPSNLNILRTRPCRPRPCPA